MKIAVLTCNLGKFDTDILNVKQDLPEDMEMTFYRWTDANFPPITGLTPRFQYRIPKMFGWQMFPGYDYYLWLDGSMSLQDPKSVMWFLNKCKDYDMALFKHPWRDTMKEETDFIELKLKQGNKYIASRYKNGLHKEQLDDCLMDTNFHDTRLYASTAFIYKNNAQVREALKLWWIHQSRYFTCDQIALPYALYKHNINVNMIEEDIFKHKYITVTSKHS
jgi:hypothetical protein